MTIVDRIQEFLKGELRTQGSPDSITSESRLIDEGILDSLLLMHLLAFLEESFAIEMEPYEVIPENFETTLVIASLVRRKQHPELMG